MSEKEKYLQHDLLKSKKKNTFTSFPGWMDLFGVRQLKEDLPKSSHLQMKEYGLFVGLITPNSLRENNAFIICAMQ